MGDFLSLLGDNSTLPLKMSRCILEGVFTQIVYNGGDVNYTIGLLWALNDIANPATMILYF